MSNTEEQFMHAPGSLKSIPHLHTQTHTDNMYRSPAIQSWQMSAQLWCIHIYADTHTYTQYCRKVGHSLKREDLCAWIERKGVWQVIVLKKTCTMQYFKQRKEQLWGIKCSTNMYVSVCVRMQMCINLSGAGSARCVRPTAGSVWLPPVVTLSLSGPRRRRLDRSDTSCWPEGETFHIINSVLSSNTEARRKHSLAN